MSKGVICRANLGRSSLLLYDTDKVRSQVAIGLTSAKSQFEAAMHIRIRDIRDDVVKATEHLRHDLMQLRELHSELRRLADEVETAAQEEQVRIATSRCASFASAVSALSGEMHGFVQRDAGREPRGLERRGDPGKAETAPTVRAGVTGVASRTYIGQHHPCPWSPRAYTRRHRFCRSRRSLAGL